MPRLIRLYLAENSSYIQKKISELKVWYENCVNWAVCPEIFFFKQNEKLCLYNRNFTRSWIKEST